MDTNQNMGEMLSSQSIYMYMYITTETSYGIPQNINFDTLHMY